MEAEHGTFVVVGCIAVEGDHTDWDTVLVEASCVVAAASSPVVAQDCMASVHMAHSVAGVRAEQIEVWEVVQVFVRS